MSETDTFHAVNLKEMEDFMERCMIAAGSKPEHAKMLASCLIAADYRGHFSHGLNRLDKYVNDVQKGTTNSDKEPTILKESGATALVDGNNLLGPVVGNFCMNLAIKKAKEIGIGMVVCRRSTHYGIAGYYTLKAEKQKMIGMSMCNTSPIVFPTRANTSTFGTNPISLAAPAQNNDSFVLDMATSSVALGKLEIWQVKNSGSNLPMPNTWGADKEGMATNDANDVLKRGGALFPLGGPEESGGYKGYGLTFMVEILCGILSGSNFGPNIRTWGEGNDEANLGQCFIVINPGNFAENFENRLQCLMDHCRGLNPVDTEKPVLVAGDPERIHMKKCDDSGGIPYHINQIKYAENLAKTLNITAPKSHQLPV